MTLQRFRNVLSGSIGIVASFLMLDGLLLEARFSSALVKFGVESGILSRNNFETVSVVIISSITLLAIVGCLVLIFSSNDE